jgi:SAM-dependent methyltransferase
VSVKYYRDLLAQQDRIEAFRRAIHAVVEPGDRVLEVGTGLGTFAFFAADAGAGHVCGIDGDPVVHVARAIARANGYADRVELIRGWIPDHALPDLADVLVFEDFPPRLVDSRIFTLLQHLHQRYLAAKVRTVPKRARFSLAPVSSDRLLNEIAPFGASDEAYGISWNASRGYLENSPLNVDIPPEDLAGDPVVAGEFAFDRPPDFAALECRASWALDHAATLHGLAFWFDLELAPGEWLYNAPGSHPGSWGRLFLPVEPVKVAAGASCSALVAPEQLPSGGPGWLRWELEAGGASARGHEFAAEPASFADVLAASPDGVPVLSRSARIEATVLDLTDGVRRVADIASALRKTYPDMSAPEAEHLVAAVLRGRASARLPDVASMEVGS